MVAASCSFCTARPSDHVSHWGSLAAESSLQQEQVSILLVFHAACQGFLWSQDKPGLRNSHPALPLFHPSSLLCALRTSQATYRGSGAVISCVHE